MKQVYWAGLLSMVFFLFSSTFVEAGKQYRLVGPDGHSYMSFKKGKLGGHKRLKIYGQLNCRVALGWLKKGCYKQHRVFFASERDAIRAGYRPCGICMSGAYRKWKARQSAN